MTDYYADPDASGADDGSSWTDAYPSIQTGIDALGAGDTLYCRGTFQEGAKVDFDNTSGTPASPLRIIGCNASGSVDGTLSVIDANSGVYSAAEIPIASDYIIENISFTGAGTSNSGFKCTGYNAYRIVFNNCSFSNNASHGAFFESKLLDSTIFRCRANNNGAYGFREPGTDCAIVACKAIGNGSKGFSNPKSPTSFIGCLAHDNSTDGFYCYDHTTYINCVSDGNTTGFNAAYGEISSLIGCRATNNTTGLTVVSGDRATLSICYFGGNTTDISGNYVNLEIDGTSKLTTSGSDTDHGYVGSSSDDFNLDPDEATYYSEAVEID